MNGLIESHYTNPLRTTVVFAHFSGQPRTWTWPTEGSSVSQFLSSTVPRIKFKQLWLRILFRNYFWVTFKPFDIGLNSKPNLITDNFDLGLISCKRWPQRWLEIYIGFVCYIAIISQLDTFRIEYHLLQLKQFKIAISLEFFFFSKLNIFVLHFLYKFEDLYSINLGSQLFPNCHGF